MTDETISAPVTETTAAPAENVQDAVAVETPEQAKPEAETPATDTAKEDAEASEAAKKLNERKAAKAERYRENERKMHDAVRRAENAERRVADLEKVQRPDAAKFDNLADYDVENAKYAATQIRKQEVALDVSEAKQEAQQFRQATYTEALDAYTAEKPDFDPGAFIAAAQRGQNAEVLAEAIMDDPEIGLRIMDVLSSRPAEIARIANLPQRQMLRELTRIENNLAQPVVKKITQAPAPVTAVAGSNSAAPRMDPAKMSSDQYLEFYKSRQASKRS
jgi:hypothetical protein